MIIEIFRLYNNIPAPDQFHKTNDDRVEVFHHPWSHTLLLIPVIYRKLPYNDGRIPVVQRTAIFLVRSIDNKFDLITYSLQGAVECTCDYAPFGYSFSTL